MGGGGGGGKVREREREIETESEREREKYDISYNLEVKITENLACCETFHTISHTTITGLVLTLPVQLTYHVNM